MKSELIKIKILIYFFSEGYTQKCMLWQTVHLLNTAILGGRFNMLVCLVTVILVYVENVYIQQVHLKAAKSSV